MKKQCERTKFETEVYVLYLHKIFSNQIPLTKIDVQNPQKVHFITALYI